ncbi:MAG TPA: hypothetical protein VFF12_13190 [Myxococcaceae bacterium]|nr:hypothetical protein [Myxococcaceae bacterium]
MRASLALLVLLAICEATASAAGTCPEAELRQDADVPVQFNDLDGLHRSYLRFGKNCPRTVYVDLAENYADRIPKVLVERWSDLERLDVLCRKEPKFRRFILTSIDATGNYNALTRLAALSAPCEGKTKLLCEDIHRQAVAALREADSVAPSASVLDGGTR